MWASSISYSMTTFSSMCINKYFSCILLKWLKNKTTKKPKTDCCIELSSTSLFWKKSYIQTTFYEVSKEKYQILQRNHLTHFWQKYVSQPYCRDNQSLQRKWKKKKTLLEINQTSWTVVKDLISLGIAFQISIAPCILMLLTFFSNNALHSKQKLALKVHGGEKKTHCNWYDR